MSFRHGKKGMTMNYKIKFINQAQGEEIQSELMRMGFVYDIGKQEARKCYGVMVKDGNIYTAGNKYAFDAYGVPRVSDIPIDTPKPQPKPKPEPKPENYKGNTLPGRTAYLARVEQNKQQLIPVIQDVLKGMKNDANNLFGTNTKLYARRCAWERLVFGCVEKHGEKFSHNTWRNAVRIVLDSYGKAYAIPGSRIIKDAINISST
jgi:hypothetical protein